MANEAIALLNRFEELVKQYSPEIIDTAADVVWVSAMNCLMAGFVAILVIVATLWMSRYANKRIAQHYDNKPNAGTYCSDSDKTMMQGIVLIASIVVYVLAGLTALLQLFDLWNWVTLFHPHLGLAQKVLGF